MMTVIAQALQELQQRHMERNAWRGQPDCRNWLQQ